MLKHRLLTAFILLPILLGLIFLLPITGFVIFIALIISLMMREWLLLCGLTQEKYLIIGSAIIFILFLFSCYLPSLPILILVILSWVYSIFILIQFLRTKQIKGLEHSELRILLGSLLLIGYGKAIMVLITRAPHPWWLLYGIFVVWGADAGAYMFGRLWGAGKRLLAPTISPKKTWIGLCGGLIMGLIIASLFCLLLPLTGLQVIFLLLTTVIIILFSIAGDLFESLMKRHAGVKDSGGLLPGHGGFLDRLDSTMAALPLLALVLLLI